MEALLWAVYPPVRSNPLPAELTFTRPGSFSTLTPASMALSTIAPNLRENAFGLTPRAPYPQTLPTARQVHFLGDSHTFRTRPHRRRNLAKSIARKISREDPIDLCRQLRGTGREQRTLLATPASVLGEHLSRRFSRDRYDMERFHDSDQTALPCSPQSRFRQTSDRGATEQGTSISRLIGREDLPVRS